jgi:integrase
MGIRDVRISQRMGQRLWELRKSRHALTETDPIFTTTTASGTNYGNLYHRMLVPAMRAAGIEHRAFHRFRHSCATQLRRRGASLEEIQLHMGHGDLSFTRRVYVDLDSSDGPDPSYWTNSPVAAIRRRRRLQPPATGRRTIPRP